MEWKINNTTNFIENTRRKERKTIEMEMLIREYEKCEMKKK